MSAARIRRLAVNPWLLAAVTAAIAFALAFVVNRIWRADLNAPLAYGNDSIQYLMYSKAIHDHGWFLENALLGAPFQLLMYDWAEGGWASMIGVVLLNAATDSWVLAHNLFYLIGYPLAAVACLWGLRRLGVAAAPAVALSVLYAILPYHQDRQTNHYVLSLYYGLPPVLSYAVTTAAGRAPLTLGHPALSRRAWLRRALPPLAAAVLAGLMSAYYVAFAGIFVLAAGLFGWLRTGRWRVLVSAVALGLVVGVALLAQYTPSLAYRLANGTNYDVGQRYHGETELYPLKPMDLLLPVPGHPIGVLAQLRERYSTFPSRGQVGVALGVAGSAGLLLALGGFVAAAAGRGRTSSLAARLRPLGWLTLTGLGVGMLGGGATLVGFVVGPYLRAWDRIAIAVAFLALAALGVILSRLRRRVRRTLRGPLLAALAVIVLVGGTLDQAGTGVWVRPYAALAEQWRSDGAFVARIDAALPDGSMVYQLPFIPFPENSRGQIVVNELLKPYLHSSSLRWSAGYVKGRDPGWQVLQSTAEPAQLITLLRALGFAGVTMHRLGYPTEPGDPLTADVLAAQISAELGPPTIESGDGQLAYWALGAAAPDAVQARDARDPVWMHWREGFDVMYLLGTHITHRTRADAQVALDNRREVPRDVVISFALRSDQQALPSSVEVTWPDGTAETVALAATGSTVVRRELQLPAGRSALRLRVPGAPPRGFAYVLVDLSVIDTSLAALAAEPGP
jgi:hypothetical protein